MATYAIGDIQGCFKPFQCLLDKIKFKPGRDQLWLAGDLVNRGPDSLSVLRFCYDNKEHIVSVLGNHDIHLLAVANGARSCHKHDTFDDVLHAPDRESLLSWLRTCPLLFDDPKSGFTLTHAGISPIWSLEKAAELAKEVETVIQSDRLNTYLKTMYGNEPAIWSDSLEEPERWRVITNYFTRMRLCDEKGKLDLSYSGGLDAIPPGYYPWFLIPDRTPVNRHLLFGHWAALNGETSIRTITNLDNGCVWGNKLKAFCLETGTSYYCSCQATY